jgi:NRPS condensation-like uncharacterized protein
MKKHESIRKNQKKSHHGDRPAAWYGLDNAANLFPAVSSDRNTNVFRLSCELCETIDRAVLQKALDLAMPDFGYFQVALYRGLFWFYLEQTTEEPQVTLEAQRPCSRIFYAHIKSLLFRVSYFGRRVNLEVFHALADGGGALELLRAIVYRYLAIQHGDELPAPIPPLDAAAPPSHRVEDSFEHNYDPTAKQSPFRHRAYAITGTLLPSNSVKIISAAMPTKQILGLAKEKKTTITAYLCALLICSIYSGLVPRRAAQKRIAVNVPVDLRGHFPSETARNFFSVVEVGFNFEGKPADFDTVLTSISEQLARQVTRESLGGRVNYTMGVQKNIFTGITPLVLKNLILRGAYHRAEAATTCALSNMGRVTMPEAFAPYIEGFHCLLNPTAQHRLKATVCSYGDRFVINFTSCIEETKAQRNFLRHLVERGVEITVTGNGGNDDETV